MLNARQLKQLRAAPAYPNRVRAAMALAKKTQNDVRAATGIVQSQISRIANSASGGVTLATASRLADYFGCTVADLFPRETSHGRPGAAPTEASV